MVSSSAVEETITTELPGGGKKTIIATSYAEVAPSSKPTGETSDPGLQDAGPTLSRNSMLPITVALVLGYILAV